MERIVIVGAGQAGLSLAERLRKSDYAGEIIMIGAEAYPPYQRPPLSKSYVTGETTTERLLLRSDDFYTDNRIDLRLATSVEAIDRSARTVRVSGEDLGYDKLALTTGAAPIALPAACGGDKGGVYLLRGIADADAMAPEFTPGRRVLIIGGGYIGLEAAAVAARHDLDVTLVELASRILARVACPETADYFRALHQGHGVRIIEGAGVETLLGDDRVEAARLTDSTTVDVDFAIVGIGVRPGIALAEAAGLDIDNGIALDEFCRTSDPAIFAAGDCCSFPYQEGRIRLESVPNAIDQAQAAADVMMGGDKPYVPRVWFWSDQYDIKLQIAGLCTGYDSIVARDGDRGRSHWYFAGSRLLGVDAMNDARAYLLAKRWIEQGVSPRAAEIADSTANLKTLSVCPNEG